MFKNYIQPSVEVFSLRIDEPVTTFTDILLALICFYAYLKIRQHESSGRIKGYFKYYFLTLGIAALSGGILGHAFLYNLSPGWKLVSWGFTLVSVALMAQGLLLLARPLIRPGMLRLIVMSNIVILALAFIFTISTLAFSAVKLYTIFGMVAVVGSMSYLIFQKTGQRATLKLLFAVGVGTLSAVFFSYQWGFSPWFNHNDVSHMILSYSALTMYKGVNLILETF